MPPLTEHIVMRELDVENIDDFEVYQKHGGYESLRKGEPFWKTLEDSGIESWVLRMPANYPTSGLATHELSGLGTPDITGGKFFTPIVDFLNDPPPLPDSRPEEEQPEVTAVPSMPVATTGSLGIGSLKGTRQ